MEMQGFKLFVVTITGVEVVIGWELDESGFRVAVAVDLNERGAMPCRVQDEDVIGFYVALDDAQEAWERQLTN